MKSSESASFPAPICNTCWTSPCRCPLPFIRVCHCTCTCCKCPCKPVPAAYPVYPVYPVPPTYPVFPTYPTGPTIIYSLVGTNATAPKPSGGTYTVTC